MIDGYLFDKIVSYEALVLDQLHDPYPQEYVARKIRKDERPFGGLHVSRCPLKSMAFDLRYFQLVLSGDFFQLPPVPDIHDGVPLPCTFAFDSRAWNQCIGHTVTLTKVFRQESEGTFCEHSLP